MRSYVTLLLLGCTGTESPTDSDHSESESEPEVIEPSWSAAEAEDAMQALLDAGIPLADDVISAYLDFMEHGDLACPGDTTQITSSNVPVEGCSSEEGWFYQGISTLVAVDWDDMTGWSFTADMTLRDEDGQTFSGGGAATIFYTPEGSTLSRVAGTFLLEGAPGPLGQGISAAEFTVNHQPDDDVLRFEGAVSLDGVGVVYDDLRYTSACHGLQGSVRLRGALDQRWYDIDFTGECEPCGIVSFQGTDLGEVCIGEHPALDDVVAVLAAEEQR